MASLKEVKHNIIKQTIAQQKGDPYWLVKKAILKKSGGKL